MGQMDVFDNPKFLDVGVSFTSKLSETWETRPPSNSAGREECLMGAEDCSQLHALRFLPVFPLKPYVVSCQTGQIAQTAKQINRY